MCFVLLLAGLTLPFWALAEWVRAEPLPAGAGRNVFAMALRLGVVVRRPAS